MSAKKFIQLLEENGVLDASTLRDVRRQISDKQVSAATIAKWLVEKGKLTKFQATKLVGQATATPEPNDDDESSLLLVEDKPAEEEIILLEDAVADAPEDVVGLTPVEDAGAALTPVGGNQSSGSGGLELLDGGLEPLGGGGLETLDSLDETGGMGAIDPFSQPSAHAPRPDAGGSGKKERREKKNQQDWGGKLMIGGGGLLLFLVLAGGLLYYNLTKQSPLTLYEAAEEAYRAESYSDAMAKFEKFVKGYSSDDNADDAQVRIVLCRIRIVIGDPQKAYDTAIELLPTVQDLEAFPPARDELATLLPTIVEGFIKKAKQAADTDGKEEVVLKAEKALADLVNKPEYVPASKRPAERLKRIDEDILIVKRAIAQDRDLAKAIVEIKADAASDKTVEAYQVYQDLLKVYPGLRDDKGLQAAVLEITEKLKHLVKLEDASIEASKTEEPSISEFRVVLASRVTNATKGVPRLNAQVVAVLAAGSVYGLNAGTGEVLWRRYVGHNTTHHPQPISGQPDADILITDGHRQELVRVTAKTGDLVWRLPLGENFTTPSIAGDQIYVALDSGKILQIDAASGNSSRRVAVPQHLGIAVGVAQIHPYLIQVGDHSNLYAISRESLACEEVIYLGHKAGTIVTPPLIVQDHVLIAENAGRDYCLLHIFKLTPGGGGLLRRPQAPIRLTGNVIVPMALYGRRPLVATDLGEVNVFNVDFNTDANTVTTATAPLPASRAAPLLSYPVIEGATLVLADNKLVKYELQISLKQITQKSVTSSVDACIAPPRLFGDILIVTRRKEGSVGATVSALQVDNFRQPEWETQIGTPIARVAPAGGSQLAAITAAGALFEIDAKVLQDKRSNEPAVTVTATGGALSFTDQVEFASGKVAFFNPVANEQALIYTPEAGAGRLRVVQLKLAGAKVTCIPAAFQDGLLAPLDNGSVMLANTATGEASVLPFQPTLGPGEDVKWQRPAILDNAFVIVDDRKNIYRVEIKQEPKPFLAPIVTGKLEVDIASDLAAAGDTVYGVVRNSGGDVIVALNAGDLKLAKEFSLTGRVVWGPVQVGNAVFCLSSTEGLLCFESGANQRWANSSGCGGQPIGIPLELAGDFVFALREGSVVRIAGATGTQVAVAKIGEPIGAGPVVFGARLLLPGSDGALHVIKTPTAEAQ